MLLAKLKDKLFNNRNSVEVESLEGDIDINDISLQECLAWVDEMSSKMSVVSYGVSGKAIRVENLVANNIKITDEADGIILPDLSFIENEELDPFFPSLEDKAGKFVKVNSGETGFEYGEVSGGTKLYQHTLSFDKDGVISSISIITNTSALFTKGFIGFAIINIPADTSIIGVGMVSTSGGGNYYYAIIRQVNYSSFVPYYFDVSTSTITAIDISGTLTDTVTPL